MVGHDQVPDICMLDWLPDFLDGLLTMLSDDNKEIRQVVPATTTLTHPPTHTCGRRLSELAGGRFAGWSSLPQAAEKCLSEFLREIESSSCGVLSSVDLAAMVPVLVGQCSAKDVRSAPPLLLIVLLLLLLLTTTTFISIRESSRTTHAALAPPAAAAAVVVASVCMLGGWCACPQRFIRSTALSWVHAFVRLAWEERCLAGYCSELVSATLHCISDSEDGIRQARSRQAGSSEGRQAIGRRLRVAIVMLWWWCVA